MVIKTNGVVIKQRNIGEQDKIITILTKDLGVIEASARGAKSMKSKILSGTQMLCFADFALYKGRSGYIVNSAEIIESFYDLRLDVEKVSLATYFCEILNFITFAENDAHLYLRLLLNTLHLLCANKRSHVLLKLVFEFKLMCISGFQPELSECSECGDPSGERYYFFPQEGKICCEKCQITFDSSSKIELNKAVLTAMRHIASSDFDKLFNFSLDEASLAYLGKVTEYYVLYHCERTFKSLDFYKNLPK
ncbi:MAG: repair protein RecO [Oscillospiraceae bacterium]|jgi:DNA repair protein RecO (recombination protein O)|nr:repair protein RecO [Oscillospiraceae bacterium]